VVTQKPGLLTLETQIEHANRKILSTEKLIASVDKDEKRQATTVSNLKRDLKDTEAAAEAAAGQRLSSHTSLRRHLLDLASQKDSEPRLKREEQPSRLPISKSIGSCKFE
jgi:septal ring factor EnvC (AmiA/AmiB activator)